MRVICPQCRGKLSIHRPSVAATRVKCRNCGHKFYAGKAEEIVEANPVAVTSAVAADEPAAAPQVTVVMAPAAIAFDEEMKVEQRASTRERWREHSRRKRNKWLIPVAVAGLLGLVVMSIAFAKKSHQVPSPPTSSLFDASKNKKSLEPF